MTKASFPDQKKINTQLASRSQTKISQLFDSNAKESDFTFLKAPCDFGVTRNGGRKGARFAPEAILNVFKSMAINESVSQLKLNEVDVLPTHSSFETFAQLQKFEQEAIQTHGNKNPIIHIGGGHDHIYPLLKSIKSPIGVINIDAHLDTRTDEATHSGTPFRQFAEETKNHFTLIQIGIHSYANAKSNYEKLKTGEMKIFERENYLEKLTEELKNSPVDTQWIFSLDCDGLDSSFMEAVSAVNHNGLQLQELMKINDLYLTHCQSRSQRSIHGIYEYNPVYDNLSQKGARALCAFIMDIVKR